MLVKPQRMHIFQTWKSRDPGTFPSVYARCQPSWQALHPEAHYELLDDAMIDDFCARWFPEFLPTFRAYPHGVQRADVIRYMLMFICGGLYVDMDFLALHDHSALVQCIGPIVGQLHSPSRDAYPNAWLMSPQPGEVLWLYVLSMAQERAKVPGQIIEWYTGPVLLTDAIRAYGSMHGRVAQYCSVRPSSEIALRANPVTILPPDVLYSIDWQEPEWREQQAAFRDGTYVPPSNALAVTYWAHGW